MIYDHRITYLNRSTAWAVFLGCNTPARLAGEMGIPRRAASARLGAAFRVGLLIRAGDGYYATRNLR